MSNDLSCLVQSEHLCEAIYTGSLILKLFKKIKKYKINLLDIGEYLYIDHKKSCRNTIIGITFLYMCDVIYYHDSYICLVNKDVF